MSLIPVSSVAVGHSFPEALQVHRAERAIVEAVAGTASLAPDHASMIGTHRTGEADIAQRPHHLEHVDASEPTGMRRFVELFIARAPNIATMHEVNSAARAKRANHRRQIVRCVGAE